jgi:16S rRNA (adenine1518-N6/adenine1519-N6)-dimethyltransferase
MFTPVPNVDSAVCKIDVDFDKFKNADMQKVRQVVKTAFSSRRKMLVNNLMNFYKLTRTQAEQALTNSGIELTVRAEELSAQDFINLSNNL